MNIKIRLSRFHGYCVLPALALLLNIACTRHQAAPEGIPEPAEVNEGKTASASAAFVGLAAAQSAAAWAYYAPVSPPGASMVKTVMHDGVVVALLDEDIFGDTSLLCDFLVSKGVRCGTLDRDNRVFRFVGLDKREALVSSLKEMIAAAGSAIDAAVMNLRHERTWGYVRKETALAEAVLAATPPGDWADLASGRFVFGTAVVSAGGRYTVISPRGRGSEKTFLRVEVDGGGYGFIRCCVLDVDGQGRLVEKRTGYRLGISGLPPARSGSAGKGGVRIEADGTVRVSSADEPAGRIHLWAFRHPEKLEQLDALVFLPAPGSGNAIDVEPGKPGWPKIESGTAPAANVIPHREQTALRRLCKLHAAANALLELSRTIRGRPITVVGSLDWSSRLLQALGQPVSSRNGRILLPVLDPDSCAENLLKTIEGLNRRIKTIQENLTHAEQSRDAAGAPNPYRRKVVELAPDGVLTILEDPSDFRRVYSPEHADAREDGYVMFPNVYAEVEKSELKSAKRELELVREILRVVAPHVIVEADAKDN